MGIGHKNKFLEDEIGLGGSSLKRYLLPFVAGARNKPKLLATRICVCPRFWLVLLPPVGLMQRAGERHIRSGLELENWWSWTKPFAQLNHSDCRFVTGSS
ncbi:hypothetical protein Tco_0425162 [Tanacetum coccineum]